MGPLLWLPTRGRGSEVRTGPSYDPTFAAYLAAQKAAGQTLSPTQISAINQRAIAAKTGANPYFNNWLAYYPFPGNSATADSLNLVNPSNYLITWFGTVTHNTNGITGDGLTGYGDLGLNTSTISQLVNSFAFGCYNRTATSIAFPCMGSLTGALIQFDLYPNLGGTTYFDNCYNGGVGRVNGTTVNNGLGSQVSSRTSASAVSGYQQGSSIASGTGAQGALPNNTTYVLTYNTTNLVVNNLASLFIGTGMTAAQVAQCNADEVAMQVALGRSVG
jgi:hypothetical protein